MQTVRKIVIAISIIMALIGLALLVLGILNGPSLVLIVVGAAFILAGFLAYKSGTTYLDEQEQERNKK